MDSHLPSIAIDGNQVTVETNHGMSNKHFIVRHTLISKDGEVLGEKTFTPDDDDAISSYTLPDGYNYPALPSTLGKVNTGV